MDETNGSHDEFFIIVEEDEIGLLDLSIMFDHNEPKHESADEI